MALAGLIAEAAKVHHKYDQKKLDEADIAYSQSLGTSGKGGKSALEEIKEAREKIHETLSKSPIPTHADKQLEAKVEKLDKENSHMKSEIKDLKDQVAKLTAQVQTLMGGKPAAAPATAAAPKAAVKADESDEDVDLFGSDDEDDAEKERLKEERVKAYADKKSKKPALVAKSSVILDVKPWDDETDMTVTEKLVRGIQMDGLVWGASKLVPLAYGIKKLQIMCVVEDEKVSIDELQEKITEFEDQVQSVDIAAFNKI